MMTTETARSLVETVASIHPRVKADDRTVAVWRAALHDSDQTEAGEALLVLLRESHLQPTPADLLRVMREARMRRHPEPESDPRATIPLTKAAAIIVADIAARMKARGQLPGARHAR